MASVSGRAGLSRYIAGVPAQLEKVLRGAARAAATVIAEEAKRRSISDAVTAAIHVRTKKTDRSMTARIIVKGPGAYLAPWLEYGTAAHFISVDDNRRNGMSVGRINKLEKEHGSLVIGGNFVGKTVLHPGARPHPFLRVSLDLKEGEARAAAQNYINSRVSRKGIVVPSESEGDGE